MYYRQHLPVTPPQDLITDDVEATWIEVRARRETHLLACIYRPPDAPVSYWPKLENMLHKATLRAATVTIVADLNVNMDQASTGAQRNHLLDTCRAYGLQNLATEPTRVSPRCPAATVLDLILASPAVATTAVVVPQTFTDHFAVEACLQLEVEHQPPGARDFPSNFNVLTLISFVVTSKDRVFMSLKTSAMSTLCGADGTPLS